MKLRTRTAAGIVIVATPFAIAFGTAGTASAAPAAPPAPEVVIAQVHDEAVGTVEELRDLPTEDIVRAGAAGSAAGTVGTLVGFVLRGAGRHRRGGCAGADRRRGQRFHPG